MKYKTFFVVFKGLSFGEKIEIGAKIADTSFKGVLIPKLLIDHFSSCSFENIDFLNPHSVHFDCVIRLPFFVLKILKV